MKFKKSICVLGAIMALGSGSAWAQFGKDEGSWMVRLRGTYLNMESSSDPIAGVPGSQDLITVNNKWIPEFDVTYFITERIATELVLTIPQKQKVMLGGEQIGTFKHLPPTLLLQYHFMPKEVFRPYIGAGVNATWISSVDLPSGMDLETWSFGPAIQIGGDIRLAPNWFLNLDIKKVWIKSDVTLNGSKISNVQLNPWLFSMGLGYRF